MHLAKVSFDYLDSKDTILSLFIYVNLMATLSTKKIMFICLSEEFTRRLVMASTDPRAENSCCYVFSDKLPFYEMTADCTVSTKFAQANTDSIFVTKTVVIINWSTLSSHRKRFNMLQTSSESCGAKWQQNI